jgi:RNA polymerase sigma factor (sigma-70 family)
MQSAFLKLTQVGADLEIADARSLRAWLARVLMNKLRDRLRAAATAARQGLGTARPSTEVMEQQAADGPTLDQLAQEAELAARMYERILALRGVDRDIVILRFVDRLPWTEIARRTGLAATTVSNRYRELIDRMVRGFF